MQFGIDIQEDEILTWGHGILETLLRDRTTDENIIWATDDYSSRGEGLPSMTRLQQRKSAVMITVLLCQEY